MEAGVIFTITLDEVKNEPVIGHHKHNLCLCFIGAIEVFSMWENTWKKKWDKILQQFSNHGLPLESMNKQNCKYNKCKYTSISNLISHGDLGSISTMFHLTEGTYQKKTTWKEREKWREDKEFIRELKDKRELQIKVK